jgi:NAD-dependent deacetylase
MPGRGRPMIFFYHLYQTGKMAGLITQNIDGLHERSGLPKEVIVNLHGSSLEIVCLDCGDVQPAKGFMEHVDLSEKSPTCAHCSAF